VEDIVSEGVTAERPPADALLPRMVDRPGKLSWRAALFDGHEWRCPHRHLLAAVIKIPLGPWVYWHGEYRGSDPWQCDWQADFASPTVDTWCDCPNSWTVDTLSPGTPPALMR
jgi:hypothetical protein